MATRKQRRALAAQTKRLNRAVKRVVRTGGAPDAIRHASAIWNSSVEQGLVKEKD